MNEELKTVAVLGDSMSAEITAGMLRDNGIMAEVFGQASSYPSINSNINGVEVKVNAKDYDEAMKLINNPDGEI